MIFPRLSLDTIPYTVNPGDMVGAPFPAEADGLHFFAVKIRDDLDGIVCLFDDHILKRLPNLRRFGKRSRLLVVDY